MFLRFRELQNASKSSPRAMQEASAISMRFQCQKRVEFELEMGPICGNLRARFLLCRDAVSRLCNSLELRRNSEHVK